MMQKMCYSFPEKLNNEQMFPFGKVAAEILTPRKYLHL